MLLSWAWRAMAGPFSLMTSGRAILDPIFWEHEPLRATASFQDQLPRPSVTDIAIFILWSRLGTRLPAHLTASGRARDAAVERAETAEAASRETERRVAETETETARLTERLAAAAQENYYIRTARDEVDRDRERLRSEITKLGQLEHDVVRSAAEASRFRKSADNAAVRLAAALAMLTDEQREQVEAVTVPWADRPARDQ
jgi:septal ring factor EnvC (AmiA/AmiB activator)